MGRSVSTGGLKSMQTPQNKYFLFNANSNEESKFGIYFAPLGIPHENSMADRESVKFLRGIFYRMTEIQICWINIIVNKF